MGCHVIDPGNADKETRRGGDKETKCFGPEMCWPAQRVSYSLSLVTLSPCVGDHKIGGKGGLGIDARGRRVCVEVPPIVADDELVTRWRRAASPSQTLRDARCLNLEVRVQAPSGSFA